MAADESKPHLKLWLKFKAEFATNPRGTAILSDNYATKKALQYLKNRYWFKIILKHQQAGRILKARVYLHTGDHGNEEGECIWNWNKPFEDGQDQS